MIRVQRANALALLILGALALPVHAIRAAEPEKPSEAPIGIPGIATQGRGVCSEQETWTYGGKIPAAWQKQFASKAENRESSVRIFSWAYVLKTTGRTPEAQALGEYWMWRSVERLGMTHLAYRGWNALLARALPPEAEGIRFAALECLSILHKSYPAMGITPAGVQASAQLMKLPLPAEYKLVIWDAVAAYARRKIADAPEGNALALEGEIALLKGSPSHESLVRALLAAHQGNDSEVVQQGERFLAQSSAAPDLEDPMRNQVARAHYHLKNLDKAIEQFKLVRNTSNYFSQSLSDLSWAYLNKNLYKEASSTAHNLILGKLSKTFSPEAATVIAIALFENCRYPEALKSVRYFRHSFEPSYRWLYQWRTKPELPENKGLYGQVANYLKKKSKVPDPVASEWVRSPVFIAYQQEINHVFDEKSAVFGLVKHLDLTLSGTRDKAMKKAKLALRDAGSNYARQIPALQDALIRQVNLDLAERNRQMLALLGEAAENSQLIEAEIYNAAGEDMIAANVRAYSPKSKETKAKVETVRNSADTLDWGRFPASKDQEAEVWIDEVGFLQTDVSSNCPQK